MGGIIWFILAAQPHGYLGSKASKYLVIGIDHIPFPFNFLKRSMIGFHDIILKNVSIFSLIPIANS
jgi:hypothetical protein